MPENQQQADYKIFVVCYRPIGSKQAQQEKFAEAIKQTSGWAKYFTDTWLLATRESAQTIWERLKPHVAEQDYLLVMQVGRDFYGTLPKKAWDWWRSIQNQNSRRQ